MGHLLGVLRVVVHLLGAILVVVALGCPRSGFISSISDGTGSPCHTILFGRFGSSGGPVL
jgi:hypothetical protein